MKKSTYLILIGALILIIAVGAIPLTCFIDAEGVLVSSINRMICAEELQAGIDSILSE